MYAVIKTGGKQYRVAPDDILEIEKIAGEVGDRVEFSDVLMVGGDGELKIGQPVVSGASVAAEVLEQGRGEKIIVFKKKRRQNYRRKRGHRQDLTIIRILEILTDGKKSKATAAKKAAPKKAEPGEGSNSEKKAAEQKAKPKKASAAKAAKAPEFKRLDAPEGDADDLKKIPGLGPKIAQKLNEYGIYHFWQLAAMSADDLGEMDTALELRGRAERDNWVDEARKLAAGEDAESKAAKKARSKA